MAATSARQCRKCSRRYEVLDLGGLLAGGGLAGLDHPSGEIVCPGCGADDFDALISVGQGVMLGGGASTGKFYPRWDPGLNCHLESDAHRKRICKERGLIPYDGDGDVTAGLSEIENTRAAARSRIKDEDDRVEHAPEYQEYRRLRDRGYFKDQENAIRQRIAAEGG